MESERPSHLHWVELSPGFATLVLRREPSGNLADGTLVSYIPATTYDEPARNDAAIDASPSGEKVLRASGGAT